LPALVEKLWTKAILLPKNANQRQLQGLQIFTNKVPSLHQSLGFLTFKVLFP
jgi:hypothetical protein